MEWEQGSAAWLPHGVGWTAVEIVSVTGDHALVRLMLPRLGGRPSHAARRVVPLVDLVHRDVRQSGADKPRARVGVSRRR